MRTSKRKCLESCKCGGSKISFSNVGPQSPIESSIIFKKFRLVNIEFTLNCVGGGFKSN